MPPFFAPRLAPLSLAAALALPGAATAAFAAPSGFPDVPETHWAADAVRYVAVEHAYMAALNGTRFEGQKQMDRLAFAQTLIQVLPELERQANGVWTATVPDTAHFSDVPSDNREAVSGFANAYRCFEGLPGVTATTFKPTAPLTRAEMAYVLNVVLARAEGRRMMAPDLRQPPLGFRDLPDGAWGEKAIAALANRYQVLDGFPDGSVQPGATLTRYQFAAAAAKIFPKVVQLIARAASPTPKPVAATPAPRASLAPLPVQPAVRFLEDAPLQLAALAGPGGLEGGMARAVGYNGVFYGQLEGRYRGLLPGALHEVGGRLGVGIPVWSQAAVQPFVAATGYTDGTTHAALGGGGLLLQARPTRWLGLTTQAQLGLPLWNNLPIPTSLNNTLFYQVGAGAQLYVWDGLALTAEATYGDSPTGASLNPAFRTTRWQAAAGVAWSF